MVDANAVAAATTALLYVGEAAAGTRLLTALQQAVSERANADTPADAPSGCTGIFAAFAVVRPTTQDTHTAADDTDGVFVLNCCVGGDALSAEAAEELRLRVLNLFPAPLPHPPAVPSPGAATSGRTTAPVPLLDLAAGQLPTAVPVFAPATRVTSARTDGSVPSVSLQPAANAGGSSSSDDEAARVLRAGTATRAVLHPRQLD